MNRGPYPGESCDFNDRTQHLASHAACCPVTWAQRAAPGPGRAGGGRYYHEYPPCKRRRSERPAGIGVGPARPPATVSRVTARAPAVPAWRGTVPYPQ
eukprot:751712-Hanusia_phi.AAC.4